MTASVLIVEDETSLAGNIARFLERRGFEVDLAETAEDGMRRASENPPDFVLSDLRLPGMSGDAFLQWLRDHHPDIPAAIMTAHGDVQTAVATLKRGAVDYLTKPIVLGDVARMVERSIDAQRKDARLRYFEAREPGRGGLDAIIGNSPAICAMKDMIRRAIESEERLEPGTTPAPVLITGETGSGKELVARALHFESRRRGKPFVELNCAALPSHLVEAELFGHERGAFTDARERRIGLVESAEGGTLFLDEIGEIAPDLQTKLLKLLEDRRVRRLGANRDREVDVRILTATNQSMEALVQERKFRADLFFRLRILQIEIPPLRHRQEDIGILAERFLAESAHRYRRKELRFSEAAMRALERHDWPGNVRELRNIIEQAVIVTPSDRLQPGDLRLANLSDGRSNGDSLGKLPEQGLQLEELERDLLTEALQRTGGNISAAARLLGLTRDTMRYRIEKFGL